MLRKIYPQVVEPVVWAYGENVDALVEPLLWKKYAGLFHHVWAASAFKGTTNKVKEVHLFVDTLDVCPIQGPLESAS